MEPVYYKASIRGSFRSRAHYTVRFFRFMRPCIVLDEIPWESYSPTEQLFFYFSIVDLNRDDFFKKISTQFGINGFSTLTTMTRLESFTATSAYFASIVDHLTLLSLRINLLAPWVHAGPSSGLWPSQRSSVQTYINISSTIRSRYVPSACSIP